MFSLLMSAMNPAAGSRQSRHADVAADAGVTLIEMLLIMVIMAILMGIAVPAFMSMGKGTGMKAVVNAVHSSMALSRQWAITKKEPVSFVCANLVTTNSAGHLTTNAMIYATNMNGQVMQTNIFLNYPICFDTPITNTFKTDGGLDGSITDPSTVTLKDTRGSQPPVDIVVKRLTGGIKVVWP